MHAPTGIVTYLFTDIVGSTRNWEEHPEAMRVALARHDEILAFAVAEHGGHVVKSTGDGMHATFGSAPDALLAALAAQCALGRESWPEQVTMKVRTGIHTGPSDFRNGDYFGAAVNRAARLTAAGHGGQILLSHHTQELCFAALPPNVTLRSLGVQRLKDLATPETVFQVQHPDLPTVFPPLVSLTNIPNNLPQMLTSFIGREQVLTEIVERIGQTHLLTLVGAGGVGKTRLSIQAAAEMLDSHPDGVFLVELAAICEPGLVPQAVAAVVGVSEKPGRTVGDCLIDHLKCRSVLLILDNCEQIVAGCARFGADLLRACPKVRILATSRERLGIAGEQTLRIPSLSMPEHTPLPGGPGDLMSFEAVRLFVDRAKAVRSDFTITDQNALALVQVCRRLDGIPLALELGAARVRSLTVGEINDRMDSRFKLLTCGDRAALPRQQTLRALIDWSYDLLGPGERRLFARLSVFAGGWTMEAVEAICASEPFDAWEILDLLIGLTDKSLVVADEIAGVTRYRLLESLRQYAADRLSEIGESEAMRLRHAAWYDELAQEAHSHCRQPDQTTWLNRLETEHDNLRAALAQYAAMPDPEPELRLCENLAFFWETRGHISEGKDRIQLALKRARATTNMAIDARSLYARTLYAAGALCWANASYDSAKVYHDECLALRRVTNDLSGIAASLTSLGNIARFQGDYATATTQHQEALVIQRELGDVSGIAVSLRNLGTIALFQGDHARARTQYEESLALLRKISDRTGVAIGLGCLGDLGIMEDTLYAARAFHEEAYALWSEIGSNKGIASSLGSLASIAYSAGEDEAARSLYGQSIALRRELEDRAGVAQDLGNLASLLIRMGEYPAARAAIHESICLHREFGAKRLLAYGIEGMAELCVHTGDAMESAILWGAADALRSDIRSPLTPHERSLYETPISAARLALGDSTFDRAWDEGATLAWDQAVNRAVTHNQPQRGQVYPMPAGA